MLDKFKLQLKTAGQSVTGARLAVFEFLSSHDSVTVAEVIASQGEVMDRASVYRTLAVFRRLNIIHDVVSAGRRMIELTDAFDSHHHHLACLNCGKITTIEDHGIERRLSEIAKSSGFTPVRHQVEMTGYCVDCRG